MSKLQLKFDQAIQAYRELRLSDAEMILKNILRKDKSLFDAQYLLGLVFLAKKQFSDAAQVFKRVSALRPGDPNVLNSLGNAMFLSGNKDEAILSYVKSIELAPKNIDPYINLSKIYLQNHDLNAAINLAEICVQNNSENIDAQLAVAHILHASEKEKCFGILENIHNKFNKDSLALLRLGQFYLHINIAEKAISILSESIELNPLFFEAIINMAVALNMIGHPEQSITWLKRADEIKRNAPEVILNLALAHVSLKDFNAADTFFQRASNLNPNITETFLLQSRALFDQERYAEALTLIDKFILANPSHPGALLLKGDIFSGMKSYEEAIIAYEKALEIDRDALFLKGTLLHAKMLSCNWREIDPLISEIQNDLEADRNTCQAFGWMGISGSPDSLLKSAKLYSSASYLAKNMKTFTRTLEGAQGRKIRIGYLGGEFRAHATSYLLCGVLEAHDTEKFSVIIYDNGYDDKSDIRHRLNKACEIKNISALSDHQAAQLIFDDKIDILLNLNGFFGRERNNIFRFKPAPIQVNYLGFPGTLGMDCIDYLIADKIVIPEEEKQFFVEKIIYLSNCYQPSDPKKAISDKHISRNLAGLPETAFVFCCFNNNYKITPEIFQLWLRIIQQSPNSVLWLLSDNKSAQLNLCKKFVEEGLDASRLIFAERLELSQHLARHSLADLFLDTLPYSAHTTANDSLWAGLPILTCRGSSFAGRVTTSLLETLNVPELVTENLIQYEEKALFYYNNPEELIAIREKIDRNKKTSPLFNANIYCRSLEEAFVDMIEDTICL